MTRFTVAEGGGNENAGTQIASRYTSPTKRRKNHGRMTEARECGGRGGGRSPVPVAGACRRCLHGGVLPHSVWCGRVPEPPPPCPGIPLVLPPGLGFQPRSDQRTGSPLDLFPTSLVGSDQPFGGVQGFSHGDPFRSTSSSWQPFFLGGGTPIRMSLAHHRDLPQFMGPRAVSILGTEMGSGPQVTLWRTVSGG